MSNSLFDFLTDVLNDFSEPKEQTFTYKFTAALTTDGSPCPPVVTCTTDVVVVQTNDKVVVEDYDDDVAQSPHCSSHNIPRNATVFDSKDAGNYSNVESTVFNSKCLTVYSTNKSSHHASKKVN